MYLYAYKVTEIYFIPKRFGKFFCPEGPKNPVLSPAKGCSTAEIQLPKLWFLKLKWS